MARDSLKREDDRQEPGLAAMVVIVASAVLTLGLFGFLVYQAATAPEAAMPEVRVVAAERVAGGGLVVTVELANRADGGFRQVVVEVDCGETPPELTFENVPAMGRRVAQAMCPPGTPQRPDVTLVTWERA